MRFSKEEEKMRLCHIDECNKAIDSIDSMFEAMNQEVGYLDMKLKKKFRSAIRTGHLTRLWEKKLPEIQKIVNTAKKVEIHSRAFLLKQLTDSFSNLKRVCPEINKVDHEYEKHSNNVIVAVNAYEETLKSCEEKEINFFEKKKNELKKASSNVKSAWYDFLSALSFGLNSY